MGLLFVLRLGSTRVGFAHRKMNVGGERVFVMNKLLVTVYATFWPAQQYSSMVERVTRVITMKHRGKNNEQEHLLYPPTPLCKYCC